jgi:hypothetical protein
MTKYTNTIKQMAHSGLLRVIPVVYSLTQRRNYIMRQTKKWRSYKWINGKCLPAARAILITNGENLTNKVAHHKDGNPLNDVRSNIESRTWLYHNRIHRGWKLISGIWYKRCARCKEMLPVSMFHTRVTSLEKGIYLAYCKPCDLIIHKERYWRKKLCG